MDRKVDLSMEGLTRAARRYAGRYGCQIENIPQVAMEQEGKEFGMFAAITGFNEYSCRQMAYQR